MVIDGKLIENLEDLSNIALSDDEKEDLKEYLTNFFEYVSSMYNTQNKNAQQLPTGPCHIINDFVQTQCMGICVNNIDTTDVIECISPVENSNIFREDIEIKSFERDLILKNTSEKDNGMFKVPKTH